MRGGAFGRAPRPIGRGIAWEPLHLAGVLPPEAERFGVKFLDVDAGHLRASMLLDCREFRGERPRPFMRNPGRWVRRGVPRG